MGDSICGSLRKFQSTPPARGATWDKDINITYQEYFNPRPPRGGRQGKRKNNSNRTKNFNPRPPRGGRHAI